MSLKEVMGSKFGIWCDIEESYFSELHFGTDQRVHLVHVAGNPHHPHLDGNHNDRYFSYPD